MRRLSFAPLLAALVVGLLALPATALADDQAVYDTANHFHAKQLKRALVKERKAIKRMLKYKYERPRLIRKAIKSFGPVRRILADISAAVRKRSASSEEGAQARGWC